MTTPYAHQPSANTSDRVKIDFVATRPLAVTFPWLAVTNANAGALGLPLEEQFAAFKEEVTDWAEASLLLTAEIFEDE